jgi:hypothetical protein
MSVERCRGTNDQCAATIITKYRTGLNFLAML